MLLYSQGLSALWVMMWLIPWIALMYSLSDSSCRLSLQPVAVSEKTIRKELFNGAIAYERQVHITGAVALLVQEF